MDFLKIGRCSYLAIVNHQRIKGSNNRSLFRTNGAHIIAI